MNLAALLVLLAQAYGQNLSDSDYELIGLAVCLLPFVLLFLLRAWIIRRRNKQYQKARQTAHTFKPPNVHGSAGVAAKDDARRKGWLK